VVLAGAEALAFLERGAHKVLRFPAAADDHRWADALGHLVDTGRFRSLEIRSVDGVGVHESAPEIREALQRAGFQQAYKGWSRRPTRSGVV
jgi:hypothetical protein